MNSVTAHSKTIARILFAVLMSAIAAAAGTISIPGLCDTGVSGTCGGPLITAGVGNTDSNWHLATPSPSAGSGSPFSNTVGLIFGSAWVDSPDGGWISNGPNSEWITPHVEDNLGGYYIYRITFNIPSGYDPATAIIGGRFSSDNETCGIFLNTVAVAGAPVSGSCINGPSDINVWTGFSVTSGFGAGNNTLDFEVRNRGGSGIDSNSNPTGLRVEFFSDVSTVSSVPEPATMGLIGSALTGLALLRRRRR